MKKLAIGIYVAVTIALLGWAYYQAIYVAPDESTMHEAQRIFYYHVPHGMLCFLFFAFSLAGSVAYLTWRHSRPDWAQAGDALALSGAEVGVVFCTVVLLTGPLWGKRAWGIWWTWGDWRLTTTLILWLIYVSYLLLRRFAEGPQMQTLAAVLGIFGAVDVPIVYMSNRWWRTQHPAPVFGGGPDSGIQDPAMLAAFGWNIFAWALWGFLILGLRYHVERQRQRTSEDEAFRALLKPNETRAALKSAE